METENIILWLRGYAAGLKDRGEEYGCAWINLAADRLDEQQAYIERYKIGLLYKERTEESE
jgi:hypothetical protein